MVHLHWSRCHGVLQGRPLLASKAYVFETTTAGAYYVAVSGPVGLYSAAVEFAADKGFFTFDPVPGTMATG